MKINIRYIIFPFFMLQLFEGFTQGIENDVLLDLSPFFHSASTVNLQYRITMPSKATALRLSGHLQLNNTTDNHTLTSLAYPGSGSSTQEVKTKINAWDLRLGWQKLIEGEKWFFYYGVDALLASNSTGINEEDITYGNYGMPRVVTTSDVNEWQYGIVPFLGIGYRFNKHFSIMVEEGMGFYQSNQTTSTKTEYYFKDNNGHEQLNNTYQASSEQKGSHISFSPDRFFRLYMAYRF